MSKVVVTGATGFLGRALVAALLRRGDDVCALSRTPVTHDVGKALEWRRHDLTAAFDWRDALAGASLVYHLAWSSVPQSSNADPVADAANIVGTVRMLEALKQAPGARLVFVSSGGVVYGRLSQVPVDEDRPTAPLCAYGVSKLAVENYIAFYRRFFALDAVTLRLGNLYGTGQTLRDGFGVVAHFMARALRKEPIRIFGDGTVVRDYLHVDDAVHALLAAGDAKTTSPVLNIGGGQGHSLNDIIAILRKTLGEIAVSHEPARSLDVPVSVLDISRAADELGWRPAIDFADGLRTAIDHARANERLPA